jgi:hypothetical protein
MPMVIRDITNAPSQRAHAVAIADHVQYFQIIDAAAIPTIP